MRRPWTPEPCDAFVEAMPKAELHLHLDGSLRVDTALELARTAASMRRATGPACTRRSSRRRVRRPGRAAARVRPADRPHAGRRGARARRRRARRDEGGRRRPLRRDPLGAAAPRRGRPARSADGIAAVCRGAAGGGATDRHRGPAHRDGAALARPGRRTSTLAETAARFRDQGLTGFDLAGPEAAFPDPLVHAARSRPPGQAASGSPSTPASGAAPARSGARSRRSGADRPRPGAIDDPELCAELIERARRRSTCARPRTSRPASSRRWRTTRWRGSIGPASRSRSHRRPDGLGHHPLRGVRPRGRADRADRCPSCGRSTGPGSTRASRRRRYARRPPPRVRGLGRRPGELQEAG